MIIYSIPFLTGVSLSTEQFAELFENEKITGIKFTAGDFYLLEQIRSAFPDKLIYAGFDEMLLPALSLNVDGAIGSTFNVNAKRARGIMDAYVARDLEIAYKLQEETNELITAIINNGLYGSLKEILKLEGVDAGYVREPMLPLSEANVARAKEIHATWVK